MNLGCRGAPKEERSSSADACTVDEGWREEEGEGEGQDGGEASSVVLPHVLIASTASADVLHQIPADVCIMTIHDLS